MVKFLFLLLYNIKNTSFFYKKILQFFEILGLQVLFIYITILRV